MSALDKIRNNECPLGHGKLDKHKRCFPCSSNWAIIQPERNGMYQASGFGRRNGTIVVYDANGYVDTYYQGVGWR